MEEEPLLETSEEICRICHGGQEEEPTLGRLFSPCYCSGSIKYVHVECLEKWRTLSQNPASVVRCDSCKYEYNVRRPALAKLLQSEITISGLSTFAFSAITLGSGSAINILSGQKWEMKNSILYGIIVVGVVGVLPKLPGLLRELLQQHWYKAFDEDFILPTCIALLTVGVVSAFTGVYLRVRSLAKILIRKLGERVLEVS